MNLSPLCYCGLSMIKRPGRPGVLACVHGHGLPVHVAPPAPQPRPEPTMESEVERLKHLFGPARQRFNADELLKWENDRGDHQLQLLLEGSC